MQNLRQGFTRGPMPEMNVEVGCRGEALSPGDASCGPGER